jgi:hypothetical protein
VCWQLYSWMVIYACICTVWAGSFMYSG